MSLKENSTDGFSNDGENSEGQSQGNNNSIKSNNFQRGKRIILEIH
ncbi:MAG: hypothetical protein R3A12_16690 [Ignavibacteria bacterium]